MKQILKLFCVAIMLFSTILANSQVDSTLYKIKLIKFQHKEHNSKIATISGLGLTVVGGVFAVLGDSRQNKGNKLYAEGYEKWEEADQIWNTGEEYLIAGVIIGGVGVITSVISGINWSVGKKKVREYQIRLDDARSGFYYSPEQVGLKLAFKF